MKKLGLIISLLLTTALLTYLALPPQLPLSPLSPSPTTYPQSSSPYLILGFAPYWNMKKLTPESLSTITHFAYFALHLKGDGTLLTHLNRREEDPGYTNYKRLLNNPPSSNPLLLTFMQEDEAALQTMLNTKESRQVAISTITTAIRDSGARGVNIDLEPTTEVSSLLRNNFTSFIEELRPQLPPESLLTISIYPSAASRPRLWDLAKLQPFTDYFVVMTYDYTMPKSPVAGPNSPLRDFSGVFEHNVLKNLGELTRTIPPAKLLLGIPLYGYEWDTVDSTKYAPTTSRGVTASLERIESMIQARLLEPLWDRNSLTPYALSTESGVLSQIYFENETSIRLKLDLVRSTGLGGIAIWALGYDNNVPWLWPTLSTLK